LTPRHLEVFIAVCDTMNMTMAAEQLYISQSAVSQTISALEAQYGVRLFERLSHKLYLTSAGEKLYSYAQHLVNVSSEIEKAMKALSVGGTLRIGASVTIASDVLPALVAEFREADPCIAITVYEGNTEEIESQLLGDKADLGLVEGEIISDDLISTPFADDELTLICSPEHRFADMAAVAPRELEKEEFIIRELGSGTRKTFENMMGAHHISWQASWTCNSVDTIKKAVMAGLGVAVMPKIAVQAEVDAGALCAKPVKGIRFSRTFKIAWHKNKYLTPALQKFIDFCEK